MPDKQEDTQAIPGTTISCLKEEDQANCMSIKSGVVGPYADRADDRAIGTEQTSSDDSNFGRDAAIAGGGTALAGAGVYGATQDGDDDKVAPETQMEAEPEQRDAVPATRSTPDTTQPTELQQPEEDSHYGRDAAIVGGTGLAGAGVYEATKGGDEEDPTSKDEPTPTTEESPKSEEKKPSFLKSLFSSKNESTPKNEPTSTTDSTSKVEPTSAADSSEPVKDDNEDHYGRDAAIIGGTGLAGAGVYEAAKGSDDKDEPTSMPESTDKAESIPKEESTPEKKPSKLKSLFSSSKKDSTPEEKPTSTTDAAKPQEEDESHYGRDAAIVGGTGLAGAGAYEATKGSDDKEEVPISKTESAGRTEPAPKDESTPEKKPSKLKSLFSSSKKDSTPKVDEAKPQPEGDDNNYGRDAAITGGVGAAGLGGLGAYEMSKGSDEPEATKPDVDAEGIHREGKGDDVSEATYTARSYPLGGGRPANATEQSTAVEEPNPNPPSIDESAGVRDTSLAGAGTIIGAGPVAADDMASEENKPVDPEVADATYTDRSYHMGRPPATSAAALTDSPHVPGEFPSETGEDPHAAGGSRETPAPEPTESSLLPGGSELPSLTDTSAAPTATSDTPQTEPQKEEDDHSYGRDAAIAGGAGATGIAAYGAYPAFGRLCETARFLSLRLERVLAR